MAEQASVNLKRLPVLLIGDVHSSIFQYLSTSPFLEISHANHYGIDISRFRAVICTLKNRKLMKFLTQISQYHATIFSIIFNPEITSDVVLRMKCFDAGVKMLANYKEDAQKALELCRSQFQEHGVYICPHCGMKHLTENALHMHMPLYHSMQANCAPPNKCPICEQRRFPFKSFYVHIHNSHGPIQEREPPFPAFSAFAWVVCRRKSDGRFLLVHEPAGLCGGRPKYWLPAGRVDKGETLVQAGVRECEEEAGIRCKITGVLEFRLASEGTPRVALFAESLEGEREKSIPCFESCGSIWVTVAELNRIAESDYRSTVPIKKLFPMVASGAWKPRTLNTKGFQDLENQIKHLTTLEHILDRTALLEKLKAIWAQLRTDYGESYCRSALKI